MDTKDDKQTEVLASESQEVAAKATTNDVDYKAELESAQAQLAKKDKQIGQAEHVIETLKGKSQDDVTAVVEKLVAEKMGAIETKLQAEKDEILIQSHSSSTDEAELIKFHLQHSIVRSDNPLEDIKKAKAIANSAKMTQKTSEIVRAQNTAEADKATTAGEKPAKGTNLNLSAADRKLMQQFGLTEEDVAKNS